MEAARIGATDHVLPAIAVDAAGSAHGLLDLVPGARIHAPADESIARALPWCILSAGSIAVGHVATALALIQRQHIGQRLGLMAAGHILRLLAVELAALGETAFVQIAALQIVAAGRAAHVARAFRISRLFWGRADAGLLKGQSTGTADSVIISGLHQALIEWRALWFARVQAAQERPDAVLNGQGQSGRTVVGQRARFLAGGQRWAGLRLALHLLQLTGLATRTLQTIARVTTTAHGAACLWITRETGWTKHAASGGGTVRRLLALNAGTCGIPTARQLHAILVDAPAILASALIGALHALELSALPAARYAHRAHCGASRWLQRLGTPRLGASQMLTGC